MKHTYTKVAENQIRRWDNSTDTVADRDFKILSQTKNSFCYWDVEYLQSKIICQYSGGVIASYSSVV